MVSHEEQHGTIVHEEDLSFFHHDPVVLELNRLQNLLKEKERDLGTAQGEIKALRGTEVLKDKVVEEMNSEVEKLDYKLGANENLLEQKIFEIKKLTNEKKDAMAAQFAAEATLRRVYADQKDDDSLPLESVIAPLEAEIKMHKNEVAALQEDKRALERLTKSKESALLEAEMTLRSALERALIVEEVQNQNFELKRQIEICQEENKILEKSNRQKVLEVKKLSQTIQELEEAILAGGAASNTISDYKRQLDEINEEKRTLEREVARFKVSVSRIANVVANEWKDDNDKVMPIKQWIEERRLLQAEMQRLRDKLTVSERTAKAEAQIKEKLKLRLKILEEGIKHASSLSANPSATIGSIKAEKFLGFLTSNGGITKQSTSQLPRGSMITSSPLKQPIVEHEIVSDEPRQANSSTNSACGEKMLRKSLWASSTVFDSGEKENTSGNDNEEIQDKATTISESEDMVSGFLYDRLQKDFINLRKLCETKENYLNDKDKEIKMLTKKVVALTKAIEVESKRMKREATAREKETDTTKTKDNKKNRTIVSSQR